MKSWTPWTPWTSFMYSYEDRVRAVHLDLSSSSHGSKNHAFGFGPNLMAACAALGLSLATDVYRLPQASLTSARRR